MHWNGGQEYTVIGHIGKGAFANVYRLGEKSTGRTVACKELEKRKFMKNGVLDIKINNELQIMKGIHHVSPSTMQMLTFAKPASPISSTTLIITISRSICILSWNMYPVAISRNTSIRWV